MPFDATPYKEPVVDKPEVQILERALELVQAGWCKHRGARCFIVPVEVESMFATRFCASGALRRANFELGFSDQELCRARQRLRQAIGGGVIIMNWNDYLWRRKRHVLSAFRTAIAISR